MESTGLDRLQQYPIAESAVLGTGGALAGYYGSDLAAKAILGLSMFGKGNAEDDATWEEVKNNPSYATFRNVLAGVGGLAGAAYPMVKSYNKNMTLGDNLSKYVNRNEFYKNNPRQLESDMLDALNNPPSAINSTSDNMHRKYDSGRQKEASTKSLADMWADKFAYDDKKSGFSQFLGYVEKCAATKEKMPVDALCALVSCFYVYSKEKEASFGSIPTFSDPLIPVHQGQALINRDPFLTEANKGKVNYLLGSTSEGNSGNISGMQLADSAIRAGVGLGAGIAFGKTMGSLFALGTSQTERLSRVGAVAGAIINTGIFSK
jgi:hypothetical protein